MTGSFGKPPAGTSYGLFYRNSGATFNLANQNGNGLALVDLARTHTVPLDEFITDTRVVGKVDLLGTHNLAFGVYYAREEEDYNALSAAVLTDVKPQAEVLDAYLVDGRGNKLYKITDNGVAQYGAEYANARGTSDNIAVYASDEWQLTNKFRLEGGVRYEQIKTQGQVEGTKKVNLGQSATSADDSVGVGTGVFVPFSRKYDHVGWTVAANYQARPYFGVFARYTDTFRLPAVSSFITNANAAPVVQTLNMIEGGVKYSRGRVDLYATAFRTVYNSYAISDYQRLANGLLSPVTVYGDTNTVGTEIEGTWRPTDWFDLHASWTWQRNRFSKFVYTNSAGVLTDYSHHRVNGVPDNNFRITPGFTLFDRKVRLQSDINHIGAIYTDVANLIRLPAYWSVDLNAQFAITPKLEFGLIVANVTNAFGLTNGNPRAGTIDNSQAGQPVYIGSSLYQRNFRGSLTYRF